MRPFEFANSLETVLLRQLESFSGDVSPELQPLLRSLQNSQATFLECLTLAAAVNVDSEPYPSVAVTILPGSDTVWQKQTAEFATAAKSSQDLVALWAIYTALDKTAQFYRQAALNTPHPLTRLFWGSLAETKSLMRRRVDGVLRIMYNNIWEQIGFAPFVLGRE
jgi:hypothetical protein